MSKILPDLNQTICSTTRWNLMNWWLLFGLFFWQGTIGFEAQIDKCLELSEYLYNKIKDREGYEMVFDGKVGPVFFFFCVFVPHFCRRYRRLFTVLQIITADLTDTQCASALCWMNAIFTSGCQCNVLLLRLMNSIMACNCSSACE